MNRETVSKKAIRNLNQLSWDERHYANFQFADGKWGLEINYKLAGNGEWKYKVECDDQEDMHRLRGELDVNAR